MQVFFLRVDKQGLDWRGVSVCAVNCLVFEINSKVMSSQAVLLRESDGSCSQQDRERLAQFGQWLVTNVLWV